MRRRKQHLTYSPAVEELHERLLWEIGDLTEALTKANELIKDLMFVLDRYNQPDIPNEKIKRNPAVVREARKHLSDVVSCAYCNRSGNFSFDPDGRAWHMDHIVPLALGGEDKLGNIVKACQFCNLKKGAREMLPTDGVMTASGRRYRKREFEEL